MSYFKSVIESLKNIPEVVECHSTTGRYTMFVKIYAKDNRHLMNIIIEKITPITGIGNTETFLVSLDEIFNRQISAFETKEIPD
jgi:Lrp/AsnC family transcriptional regulator for asnA, asnC and gidA